MGIGFASGQVPAAVQALLDDLRARSEGRNRRMVAILNEALAPAQIDYEQDLLPLTPAGNPTERHLVQAYLAAAERLVSDPVSFWAERLALPAERVADLRQDPPAFQNAVRSKLMKRGGVAYMQPGPDTFPTLERFNALVTACGALPCATWLDGVSPGEQAMEELLTLLMEKEISALNVVPDRNWNIADPEARRMKVQNLYDVVALAEKLDLPLNVGTEMNSPGQKWVDDFEVPELAPVRQAFLDGAYFIYGHTLLQRTAGMGFLSEWAREHLPDRTDRNDFYQQVGRRFPPGRSGQDRLRSVTPAIPPDEVLHA